MTQPRLKTSRHKNIQLLVIIGVISVLIRLFMEYQFDHLALLYVGLFYYFLNASD